LAVALGVQTDSVLDLSMSLNPLADPIGPIAGRHVDALSRYPDSSFARAAVAEAFGRSVEEVLLTNGGAGAIALLADEMKFGWVDDPDFSLYRRHLHVRPGAPRWRSNPHSPSGRLAPPDDRAAVWDEAFYPLATGRWTAGDREAITLGSFTKVFACPGLRLGYVLSTDTDLVARLETRQSRWPVSSLALAVIPELLEASQLSDWQRGIAGLRDQLVGLLQAHSYQVQAGEANWVLVADAPDLRARLGRQAIAVRDCATFGLTDTVRIAVPDSDGLERLSHALAHIDAAAT